MQQQKTEEIVSDLRLGQLIPTQFAIKCLSFQGIAKETQPLNGNIFAHDYIAQMKCWGQKMNPKSQSGVWNVQILSRAAESHNMCDHRQFQMILS